MLAAITVYADRRPALYAAVWIAWGARMIGVAPYCFAALLLLWASNIGPQGNSAGAVESDPVALRMARMWARELAVPFDGAVATFTSGADDSNDLWTNDLGGQGKSTGSGSKLTLSEDQRGTLELSSSISPPGALVVSGWKNGDGAFELANTFSVMAGETIIEVPALRARWKVESIESAGWYSNQRKLVLSVPKPQVNGAPAGWEKCRAILLPKGALESGDESSVRILPLRTAADYACPRLTGSSTNTNSMVLGRVHNGGPADDIGQSFFSVTKDGKATITVDPLARVGSENGSMQGFVPNFARNFDAAASGVWIGHFRVRLDGRLRDDIYGDEGGDRSALVPVLSYRARTESVAALGAARRMVIVKYRSPELAPQHASVNSNHDAGVMFSIFAPNGRRDEGAFARGAEMVPLPLGGRFRALTQDNSLTVGRSTEFSWYGGRDVGSAESSSRNGSTRWLGDPAIGAIRITASAAYVPWWIGFVVLLAGVARLIETPPRWQAGPIAAICLLATEWLICLRILVGVQELLLHGGPATHVYSAIALLWVLPTTMLWCSQSTGEAEKLRRLRTIALYCIPAVAILSLYVDLSLANSGRAIVEYVTKWLLPVALPVSVVAVAVVLQLVRSRSTGVRSSQFFWESWSALQRSVTWLCLVAALHFFVTKFGGSEQISVLGGIRVSAIFVPAYVLALATFSYEVLSRELQSPWQWGGAFFAVALSLAPLGIWISVRDSGLAICFGFSCVLYCLALAYRGDFLGSTAVAGAGGNGPADTRRNAWTVLCCAILPLVPLTIVVALLRDVEAVYSFATNSHVSAEGALALALICVLAVVLLIAGRQRNTHKTWILLVPAFVALGAASIFTTSHADERSPCTSYVDDKSFIACSSDVSGTNRLRLKRLLAEAGMRGEATSDAISQTIVFDEMRHFASLALGTGYLNAYPRRYVDKFDGVVSEHILQPFGRVGGLGALFLYLAVFAICAWNLSKTSRGSCIALLSASVFAGMALYVFLSVAGLLPFTGRNAYFLTAISFSDWIEGYFLLSMVVVVACIQHKQSAKT